MKIKRSLSTSYTQFVDNVMLSGLIGWQDVDENRSARCCGKKLLGITISCISEKHDFYRLFSAFFYFVKYAVLLDLRGFFLYNR